MPQFILYTHDDAVSLANCCPWKTRPSSHASLLHTDMCTKEFILSLLFSQTDDTAWQLIQSTIQGFKNPNGCGIPVTFFTMEAQTDCAYVQKAWAAGHEISTHTVSHLAMPIGFKGGAGDVQAEIVNVRTWLETTCQIPAADVVGFRAPYLVYNPPYFQALSANNFLYDSSINEHWPMPTSPSGSDRLWPYTMDYGIVQDCDYISGDECDPGEHFDGLWEVPVWVLQDNNYPVAAYAMDPCTGENGPCTTSTLLESYFQMAYNGNKAPVPLYIHSPWLSNYVSICYKYSMHILFSLALLAHLLVLLAIHGSVFRCVNTDGINLLVFSCCSLPKSSNSLIGSPQTTLRILIL